MSEAMGPTPEAIGLRAAVDPNQSCANCGNMTPGPQGELMCNVLGMPVQPQMVSDQWMPQQAAPGAMPQGGPGQMPPGAGLDALFGGPGG